MKRRKDINVNEIDVNDVNTLLDLFSSDIDCDSLKKYALNYVKSIGREIFVEPDTFDFNIIVMGFPPKNLDNLKDNTLEKNLIIILPITLHIIQFNFFLVFTTIHSITIKNNRITRFVLSRQLVHLSSYTSHNILKRVIP